MVGRAAPAVVRPARVNSFNVWFMRDQTGHGTPTMTGHLTNSAMAVAETLRNAEKMTLGTY